MGTRRLPIVRPAWSGKVASLLEQSGRAQQKRQLATRRQMDEIQRRLKHIAFVIADWKLRFVLPRLAELAAMFRNAAPPMRDGTSDSVTVMFSPTQDLPVEARVSVSMTPDPPAEKIQVTFAVLMMPVSPDFEREASITVWVQAPDTKQLEEFLDARIVRFVEDYLKVRDPSSPYQAERVATDPVCMMAVPIVDAADSVTYKDHTYYFCITECRRKFEADPGRYVKIVEKRQR